MGEFLSKEEKYFQIANGHFTIHPVVFGPDDEKMQGHITIKEWRKNIGKSLHNTQHGHIFGIFYDACWTFVDTISKFNGGYIELLEYARETDLATFKRMMYGSNFSGVSTDSDLHLLGTIFQFYP